MKKTHTPSFILELEISFSDNLLNEVYPVSHKGEPFFRCTPGQRSSIKSFALPTGSTTPRCLRRSAGCTF